MEFRIADTFTAALGRLRAQDQKTAKKRTGAGVGHGGDRQATDEDELREIYDTERHLLYVACTRARDRLQISGMRPGSEFIGDLAPM